MEKRRVKPLSRRQKVALLLAATAAMGALAGAPAYAEGSWTSSVSNGTAGVFSSRWWTDNQIDSASTRVKFSDCTTAVYVNAQRVKLYRDNGLFPDHYHGQVQSNCNGTYASWGAGFPAGSFRWQLGEVGVASGTGTAWTTGYPVTIPSLTTQY